MSRRRLVASGGRRRRRRRRRRRGGSTSRSGRAKRAWRHGGAAWWCLRGRAWTARVVWAQEEDVEAKRRARGRWEWMGGRAALLVGKAGKVCVPSSQPRAPAARRPVGQSASSPVGLSCSRQPPALTHSLTPPHTHSRARHPGTPSQSWPCLPSRLAHAGPRPRDAPHAASPAQCARDALPGAFRRPATPCRRKHWPPVSIARPGGERCD